MKHGTNTLHVAFIFLFSVVEETGSTLLSYQYTGPSVCLLGAQLSLLPRVNVRGHTESLFYSYFNHSLIHQNPSDQARDFAWAASQSSQCWPSTEDVEGSWGTALFFRTGLSPITCLLLKTSVKSERFEQKTHWTLLWKVDVLLYDAHKVHRTRLKSFPSVCRLNVFLMQTSVKSKWFELQTNMTPLR